jgi:hypothetical protein
VFAKKRGLSIGGKETLIIIGGVPLKGARFMREKGGIGKNIYITMFHLIIKH